MVHRIGLFTAAGVATIALTVALALAGFAPGAASPTASPTSLAAAPAEAPTPTTKVDTIYVKPAPSPATIRIVRPAGTASGGERSDGGEGGGGDD